MIESVFSWLLKLCKWLLHALFFLPERKCIAFSLKFNYLWWWIDFFQQYNIPFLSLSLSLLTQLMEINVKMEWRSWFSLFISKNCRKNFFSSWLRAHHSFAMQPRKTRNLYQHFILDLIAFSFWFNLTRHSASWCCCCSFMCS